MATGKKIASLAIPMYSLSGKSEKKMSLPKEIFGVKVSPRLLAQAIRIYLTNQRQGTASTKTRGEVVGSTRKIYRQKGTGRARHGDIKAPIFVGGGVVGGPKPKKYSLKINKKQKRQAFLGALSLKYQEGNLMGLGDDFLKIPAKTKTLADFFKKSGFEKGKKLIIIPSGKISNLKLAVRNIPSLKITSAKSANVYKILSCGKVFIFPKSVEVIKNIRNKNEN